MATEIQGGCLCGQVRYRFSGEALAFYACHCTNCQCQSGSAFGLSMVVQRAEVFLLEGNPAAFEVQTPDGLTKKGRYCSHCVARLWGEPVKFPQLYVLRPGTFDTPFPEAPFGDIWTRSAQPWVTFTKGPHFEGQPEEATALVKAWQKHESAGA